MLVIRPEQMKQFIASDDADFAARLAGVLRQQLGGLLVLFPERNVPLSELKHSVLDVIIRRGMCRARAYGLESERSRSQFITLRFMLGPRFDEFPPFRKVLTDKSIPATQLLDEIYTRTTEQDWVQAIAGYDRHSWEIK